MTIPFRVIDTGLRGGRANIAFDQALIEARLDDAIPDSIRFLAFTPSALVGRHQDLSLEVDLQRCQTRDVEVARRITGGGAIYFDQGQLGWELVFRRRHLPFTDLGAAAAAICEAAAMGLSTLGIDAQFRPRNDIEVAGRKLCGTGGFFEDDVLFYQGTLLIDTDPTTMAEVLKVPRAKLVKRGLDDVRRRVVTLRELLGDGLPDKNAIQAALLYGFRRGLDIDAAWGETTTDEEARAEVIRVDEIGRDDFVHAIDDPGRAGGLGQATHHGAGGIVTAYARLEGAASDRIREVLITGDFVITPPRRLFDLEASLRGVRVGELSSAIDDFFSATAIDALSLTPEDLKTAVLSAADAARAPTATGTAG